MSIPAERFSIRRVLAVGGVLSCLVPLMAHYSIDLVHASNMAIDFMPVAGIAIFFAFVLFVNTALRFVSPRAALTRPELLAVYTMLIVACSITTMGLGSQLLPIMGAPHQYTTTENRWATIIQPHVPSWLMPPPEVISGFFIGQGRGVPIPWGAWLPPLAAWLVFLVPGYFIMIAVMVMLRKQWVEREHLIFPLTVLPAAMGETPEHGRVVNRFFRHWGMWIGFTLVFCITGVNALHNYWDVVPGMQLVQTVPVFRNTVSLIFRLSFPVLGLAFLINTDLAFSLWFFNLLFLCLTGTFNILGVRLDENLGIYGSSTRPILAYLGMGAITGLVFTGLWNAREHLRGVFAKACGRASGTDDTGEIMSYRCAVWGSFVSLVIMWTWLTLAGLSPLIAPLYLALAFILFLGLTRIVSEGGLPTIVAAMIAPTAVVSMLGVNAVGAAGLVVLGLMYVWSADIRIFPMAECAQGLKLAQHAPENNRRGIVWAMAAALVISFVISVAVSLKLAYTHGGITLSPWYFEGGPQAPFRLMADKIQNPSPPSAPGYALMALGGAVTIGLSALRTGFAWFSLHPIGFTVGSVWLMDQLWFSIFLAWLLKTLILRYGGPLVYKRVVPFFLGLVLGQYTAAAFWFVVDLITGKTGNRVFWI